MEERRITTTPLGDLQEKQRGDLTKVGAHLEALLQAHKIIVAHGTFAKQDTNAVSIPLLNPNTFANNMRFLEYINPNTPITTLRVLYDINDNLGTLIHGAIDFFDELDVRLGKRVFQSVESTREQYAGEQRKKRGGPLRVDDDIAALKDDLGMPLSLGAQETLQSHRNNATLLRNHLPAVVRAMQVRAVVYAPQKNVGYSVRTPHEKLAKFKEYIEHIEQQEQEYLRVQLTYSTAPKLWRQISWTRNSHRQIDQKYAQGDLYAAMTVPTDNDRDELYRDILRKIGKIHVPTPIHPIYVGMTVDERKLVALYSGNAGVVYLKRGIIGDTKEAIDRFVAELNGAFTELAVHPGSRYNIKKNEVIVGYARNPRELSYTDVPSDAPFEDLQQKQHQR